MEREEETWSTRKAKRRQSGTNRDDSDYRTAIRGQNIGGWIIFLAYSPRGVSYHRPF